MQQRGVIFVCMVLVFSMYTSILHQVGESSLAHSNANHSFLKHGKSSKSHYQETNDVFQENSKLHQETDPDSPLKNPSFPQINVSALREFLSRCKLADGGFMRQPIVQGIPQSETWATFLVAWTGELIGLQELLFLKYDRSPLDYFAQLITPTSGLRNNTLSSTVTVFSTSLGLLLWSMNTEDPSILTEILGDSALTFLLDAQDPLGGFAESSRHADFFTTTLALQALEVMETQPHNPFTPRTYLNSLYLPEVGQFDDPELNRSGLWETWCGVWAAHLVMPWKDLSETLPYILDRQQADGSWGSLTDTFAAVSALSLLDHLDSINHTQLLAYVSACQYLNNSDHFHGGFRETPEASSETVSSINTAYALYISHVLEGLATGVTYTFSTDQDYYIQGESAFIYVEPYYGDESLESLNMTFTLGTFPPVSRWSTYDPEYGAYWQQFDTTALFAVQSIKFGASWDPTFLTKRIDAPLWDGNFVVGYEISLTVGTSTIEPGMNTTYTITVSNIMTSVPYPVDCIITGPGYQQEDHFLTEQNGTMRLFQTPPEILLGAYHITAILSIPEINQTRSTKATIEVDTLLEVEVEGLAPRYTVGAPLQMIVYSWYNSSHRFPYIPLAVHFDYHEVVSWTTDLVYGIDGIYHINTTIPVEPILGEVRVFGIFHFPDFTAEVDLGTTRIQFALTVHQVQIPDTAYLARSLQATYQVSSTEIPAVNLTDFQSYLQITTTEPINNQTFIQQIDANYINGEYWVNWPVDPNLPATLYNLTIHFKNPFGETVLAYHTLIRFEEVFHIWIPTDFPQTLTPGETVQLDFVLYWTDDPNYVNLQAGAIAGLELEASSSNLNISTTPLSRTIVTIATYRCPGYGLLIRIPKGVPDGVYSIFIYKSKTRELVTTIGVQVHGPPPSTRTSLIVPIFVIFLLGVLLFFGYLGVDSWREGRATRKAQRLTAHQDRERNILRENVRLIDRQLQSMFQNPILHGSPRKPKQLQAWLKRFVDHPDVRGYLELVHRYNAFETTQELLPQINIFSENILGRQEFLDLSEAKQELFFNFQKHPIQFIEQSKIDILQRLVKVLQRLVSIQQVTDSASLEQNAEIESVKMFIQEEQHILLQYMSDLETSEDYGDRIRHYLEVQDKVTQVLQLQQERRKALQLLNQLRRDQKMK